MASLDPYKGMRSVELYHWFNNTLNKIKKDDEYQRQKLMNETFTKMMREGYEDAKKVVTKEVIEQELKV